MNTCNESVVNDVGSAVSENNDSSMCGTGDPGLSESMWSLPYPPAAAGAIAAIYTVIFVIAFCWNLFLIGFMIKNRKMLRGEPSSIFLFCLAVVDFLEATSSIPFYIATLIQGGWFFGETDTVRMQFCCAIAFFLSLFLCLSIYLLAIIAFDRFLYIVYSFRYHRLMKPWRAWLLVLCVCVVPVIISSTPFYGFGAFFYFPPFGACLFRWRAERDYVIVFAVLMVIPVAFILVFTIITYFYVRRFLRGNLGKRGQWSVTSLDAQKVKERNLTRLFAALVITQLVCFSPALLTAFIGRIFSYDNVPNAVFLIDFILVLLNSAINPIIQSFLRKPIRDVVLSVIKCPFCMPVRPVSDSSPSGSSGASEPPIVQKQDKSTERPSLHRQDTSVQSPSYQRQQTDVTYIGDIQEWGDGRFDESGKFSLRLESMDFSSVTSAHNDNQDQPDS